MIRGGTVAAAGLLLLSQCSAFMPPTPPAAHRGSMLMRADKKEGDKSKTAVGMSVVGRSLAATGVLLSTFLGGGGLPGAWAAPSTADKQTTSRQVKKAGGKEEQKVQKEENKDLSNVIAKGTIRLPEIEGYPLGPERPAQLNYALENNDAALLLTCYGREGGPIAAKKIKLQGLEFPYTFELTFNNLLFPLTKEAWEKDNRAFDDLGISALLDLDGKFSTANENDLLGFGISKPVAIAGSQIRRDALILVTARTGVKQYTDEEQRLLSTIDLELARQAQGGSLAQLASESGGGNINVISNQRQTEPSDPAAAPAAPDNVV